MIQNLIVMTPKEKKKDSSSESESDTEKQVTGKEKEESAKEDTLQAESKEEGERPEETEPPAEGREIELVQEIPAQQYAVPPKEEETDEEVQEESESESDSDLSDLEEGETKIRYVPLSLACIITAVSTVISKLFIQSFSYGTMLDFYC